jgi:hypothetical protein
MRMRGISDDLELSEIELDSSEGERASFELHHEEGARGVDK